MSRTRYEWTLFDCAIGYAGAVSVPIYETSSADQVAWILEDSGAVAIHARDAEVLDIADVRVSVDGEAIAERLDGRALTVDPGSRTFRFVKAGAPEVAMTLLHAARAKR